MKYSSFKIEIFLFQEENKYDWLYILFHDGSKSDSKPEIFSMGAIYQMWFFLISRFLLGPLWNQNRFRNFSSIANVSSISNVDPIRESLWNHSDSRVLE